jgi:hypothetical protein
MVIRRIHWRDIKVRRKRVAILLPRQNRGAIALLDKWLGHSRYGWCGRKAQP